MRKAIGVTLVLCAGAIGVWVFFWWGLVGGVMQIVEQVKAPHTSALWVALGVVRVLFAGPIAVMATKLVIIPAKKVLGTRTKPPVTPPEDTPEEEVEAHVVTECGN